MDFVRCTIILNIEILIVLYTSLMLPHLNKCYIIWGIHYD